VVSGEVSEDVSSEDSFGGDSDEDGTGRFKYDGKKVWRQPICEAEEESRCQHDENVEYGEANA